MLDNIWQVSFTLHGTFNSLRQGDIYLLEELRHLTHQAGVALHFTFVSVGQEEVAQQRGVRQRLDDAVHEAGVPQVYQTSQAWGTVGVRWGANREEKHEAKK